jgi:hypothetical protein
MERGNYLNGTSIVENFFPLVPDFFLSLFRVRLPGADISEFQDFRLKIGRRPVWGRSNFPICNLESKIYNLKSRIFYLPSPYWIRS